MMQNGGSATYTHTGAIWLVMEAIGGRTEGQPLFLRIYGLEETSGTFASTGKVK